MYDGSTTKYSDSATIGNPFRGTPEKGLALFEREAEHLAAFLEEVKNSPLLLRTKTANSLIERKLKWMYCWKVLLHSGNTSYLNWRTANHP